MPEASLLDPQDLGGLYLDPVGPDKGVNDQPLLDLREPVIEVGLFGNILHSLSHQPPGDLYRKVLAVDDPVFGHDGSPFDDIFKLPYVSRPIEAHNGLKCRGRNL